MSLVWSREEPFDTAEWVIELFGIMPVYGPLGMAFWRSAYIECACVVLISCGSILV